MTTMAPSATGNLLEVALNLLEPHPDNRKRFDEGQIAELAESLQEKGQLTPALVRAHGRGYQLLAGERRWRAAKLAGLPTLLCMVRDLDDQAALEVLAIENNHREDVHPLEEADLYKALLQFKGYDVQKVATKIRRSAGYVRERLRLLRLTPRARELTFAGEIPYGHAVLLAGLSAEDQKRAIGEKEGRTNFGAFHVDGLFRTEYTLFEGRQHRVVVSLAEFRDWIRKRVRFDPKLDVATELFPETVAMVKEAEAAHQKVLRLTTDYRADDQVKDPTVRTIGKDHWKRADGTKGSKVCEFAQLGVVVSGEAQGLAFAVCIRKDKCTVHWAAAQKEAARRRRERVVDGVGPAAAALALTPAQRKERVARRREEALEQRLEEAHGKLVPHLAKAVEKVTLAPTSDLVAKLLERHRLWSINESHLKLVPKGKTAEQLLRHLLWLVVLEEWDELQGDRTGAAQLLKSLGLDLDGLITQLAPAKLEEATAFCERCGCTQEEACHGGCAWDPESWRKGKAVCTSCLEAKPTKKLAGDVRRARKAKAGRRG
ncbi:MAG: ParB/RepB/Spo0J family partition protein [Gemmatimonadetes bacterium]|nr:ParB/RepB/Spo0J family partition protein [Gemmatimonadota bacterium]